MTHPREPREIEKDTELAIKYTTQYQDGLGISQEGANLLAHGLLRQRQRAEKAEAERDTYKHEFKMFQAGASRLRKQLQAGDGLVMAIKIAANQLEGVALAIERHGQNINMEFFILTYKQTAEQARQALANYQKARGDK